MGRLEGKVAVITGGSSGLALASAKRFVEEDAYVFIVGVFFHEPLGALKRQAARSTRDDCNLTFKLSHDDSLW